MNKIMLCHTLSPIKLVNLIHEVFCFSITILNLYHLWSFSIFTLAWIYILFKIKCLKTCVDRFRFCLSHLLSLFWRLDFRQRLHHDSLHSTLIFLDQLAFFICVIWLWNNSILKIFHILSHVLWESCIAHFRFKRSVNIHSHSFDSWNTCLIFIVCVVKSPFKRLSNLRYNITAFSYSDFNILHWIFDS